MRLVRDVAMLWVRQDRARQFEAASLDARARRAGADFDQARSDRADGLIDTIEANPRATRRALLAMPEGVDRLVDGLTMLLGEITGPAPAWSPAHHKRLNALFGYRVGDLPWNRPTRFSKAILGDYEAIGDAEIADVPLEEQTAWAMTRLVEAIGAEVARLAEHRATIDRDRIAEDRADAIARASLDLSKDGVLAQRYIAAAARDLSRALRDLHLVESAAGTDPEATLGAEPTPDPIAEPEPTAAPENGPDPVASEQVMTLLASFGESAPVVPLAAPAAAMSAPVPAIWPVPTAEPAAFSPSFPQ